MDDQKEPVKYLDLCSGIGGFHQAMDRLGCICVGASEIDQVCIDTYRANFPDTPMLGDVRDFDPKDLPVFQFVCAGFPCQPFSKAGKRKGFKDESRGQLFYTIMDIIPISTKVLGKIGEGITLSVTGVYVILTGVDGNGKQSHEGGSSEGNLKDQLYLNRAGTPGDNDYIISFDVTLAAGMGQERPGPTAAHRACDKFIQSYRDKLKKFKGEKCTERHEYHDIVRPGKKRVLIVKQVAGQGAMYDTHLFAKEPSGVEGGRSIIDMGNMPVLVTPNEYRDGIIRSMQ